MIIYKPKEHLKAFQFTISILPEKVTCKGVQDNRAHKKNNFCFQQGQELYFVGVTAFCG